jgi:predicted transposase YbfD/YdcC
LGIADCRIGFRVDREVWRGSALKSCDTRYFVTSLDPETVLPSDLQSLTRGHWQVENCLHHIKDRTLNEDRHSLRRDGLGPRMLKIRDLGVSVLHLLRKVGESVREIAETIHFRPETVLQTIGLAQSEL